MDLKDTANAEADQAATPLLDQPDATPATSKRAPYDGRYCLAMFIPLLLLALAPLFVDGWLDWFFDDEPIRTVYLYASSPNVEVCELGATLLPWNMTADDSLSMGFYLPSFHLDDMMRSGKRRPMSAMSRNGKTLVLGEEAGPSVRVYYSDDSDDAPLQRYRDIGLEIRHNPQLSTILSLQSLALSGDGSALVAAGWNTAILVNVSDQSVTVLPGTDSLDMSIKDLAMNEDGSWFVVSFWSYMDWPDTLTGEPLSQVVLFEQTAEGPISRHTVASDPALLHTALSGNTLVVAWSAWYSDQLVVKTLRRPSGPNQPFREHWQTIQHACEGETDLAVSLSSNGTLVSLAARCEVDDSVRVTLYVLVWNETTADYTIHQPWTKSFTRKRPVGDLSEPIVIDLSKSTMKLAMSGDASMTILTLKDTDHIIWTGDLWTQPQEASRAPNSTESTPSFAISEDASTILLTLRSDRPWEGGFCLLTAPTASETLEKQ